MQGNNDKTMAIIAYILFFIPLIAVQNRSAFLNFHVNQGLNLFIVGVAGSVILNLLHVFALSQVWGLVVLVLAIMGIISASKNEMKPLPVIGGLFNLIK
ncbi:MAG: hypothetical protein WCO10_03440 [bacterium]